LHIFCIYFVENSLLNITICNIHITDRYIAMKLSEKIRYLREVEGSLRGLDRAMTQQEVVQAIHEAEAGGRTISQSYLSQIESGARPHLTNTTRLLLARFFKVHPGYLVDDPEGYHAELMSDLSAVEDKLDLWLISGAERFRRDPCLGQALLTLARHDDSRRCLMLLESILDTPGLAERLLTVLRPDAMEASAEEPGCAPVELAQPSEAAGSRNLWRPLPHPAAKAGEDGAPGSRGGSIKKRKVR
jgi:transcriptional regulator with XRE-family HTH domain